jgi:uncharacterized membrane protein YsdA (DUF1294 family)
MARRRKVSPHALFGSIGAAVTLGLTGLLRASFELPWLLAFLSGVNAATFGLYGYDKVAARARYLRAPESVLHAFAFAGGTPLAFVSQRLFRHKTAKGSFRLAFWLIALLQLAIVVWALAYWKEA